MAMNKKIIWVMIGIVVLLLYMNQPREKGFKKQAGETFQVGYTGSTNSVQYLYTSTLKGQTFTPLNNFGLSSIKLRLSKGGSPTGALTIGVRDTSGGLPTGIDLSSTSIPVSDITTTTSVYTFNMPSISLTTGTKYAIVAYGVEGSDLTNSIAIWINISDNYPDGEFIQSLISTSPTRDAYFEVWGSTIEGGNVVFRTNAVLPLLGEPGKWIAVKYDARIYTPTSGLTSYKYYNKNSDCMTNGINPATYTLFPYSLSNGASIGYDEGLSSPYIFIWDPHYFNNSECPSNYYSRSWYTYNSTIGAELSLNPTEPYTSNGQEVIEGVGPVCGDGICETGENCPSDATGCPDNPCYEPTCTNGCGEVLVADGGTDESCVSPNYCNGAGICSSSCDVTFNEFISISNAWVGCTAGGCV